MTTNPKGKQLRIYLAHLTEHLSESQQTTLKELESLRKNIEHIKDIVVMQQNYAKISGVREIVQASDLVEDSYRILGALNPQLSTLNLDSSQRSGSEFRSCAGIHRRFIVSAQ